MEFLTNHRNDIRRGPPLCAALGLALALAPSVPLMASSGCAQPDLETVNNEPVGCGAGDFEGASGATVGDTGIDVGTSGTLGNSPLLECARDGFLYVRTSDFAASAGPATYSPVLSFSYNDGRLLVYTQSNQLFEIAGGTSGWPLRRWAVASFDESNVENLILLAQSAHECARNNSDNVDACAQSWCDTVAAMGISTQQECLDQAAAASANPQGVEQTFVQLDSALAGIDFSSYNSRGAGISRLATELQNVSWNQNGAIPSGLSLRIIGMVAANYDFVQEVRQPGSTTNPPDPSVPCEEIDLGPLVERALVFVLAGLGAMYVEKAGAALMPLLGVTFSIPGLNLVALVLFVISLAAFVATLIEVANKLPALDRWANGEAQFRGPGGCP